MGKHFQVLVLVLTVAVLVAATRPRHEPSPGTGVGEFFAQDSLLSGLAGETAQLTVDGVALGMSRAEVEVLLGGASLNGDKIRLYPRSGGRVIVEYDALGLVKQVVGFSLEFGGHQILAQEKKELSPSTVLNLLGSPDHQSHRSQNSMVCGPLCWRGLPAYRYDALGVTVYLARERAGIHLGPRLRSQAEGELHG